MDFQDFYDAADRFRYWSGVFAAAEHVDHELAAEAISEALTLKQRVLGLGNEAAAFIVSAGGDVKPLLEYLALVRMGGRWKDRQEDVRRTWATAYATLQSAALRPFTKQDVSDGTRPKATIAARMIDLIKDPSTHTWSARDFATKLGCSASSIVTTSAWKQLTVSREMVREGRAERSYHKNRTVQN